MALFKRQENKEKTEKQTQSNGMSSAPILLTPRLTEKAALLTDNNVYTFKVSKDVNKVQIKEAVKEMYNVTPLEVRITKTAAKKKRRGRTIGSTSPVKKAYVTLKKGDSIEFV
jgi:large subunit ribosomal protein L23